MVHSPSGRQTDALERVSSRTPFACSPHGILRRRSYAGSLRGDLSQYMDLGSGTVRSPCLPVLHSVCSITAAFSADSNGADTPRDFLFDYPGFRRIRCEFKRPRPTARGTRRLVVNLSASPGDVDHRGGRFSSRYIVFCGYALLVRFSDGKALSRQGTNFGSTHCRSGDDLPDDWADLEALDVHNNLVNTNNKVANSLKRLSSGLRITSAKDDSAGFAIANSFAAKISAMSVASQNASEAQSMLQTADGAYTKINDILVRMKSLATQAASGQTESLTTMNNEFNALQNEIDRIAGSTKYGAKVLVDGSGPASTGITFQVGATNSSADQIVVKFDNATAFALGVSTSVGINGLASAQDAMTALDIALTSINSYMGSIGGYQNRLQYTIDNLATSIQNYSSSESTIRDVDMASEISDFTKNQILQQAGMAMLAQANSGPQQILTLLR